MSNTKLSSLTALSIPVGADLIYVIDSSVTTDSADGSSRKLTLTDLFGQANVINTALVTLTGTEVLTNKTFNLTNNTLTGTIAEFNTALSDANFATLTGTETLSGKTLTAPKFADGGFIADANGNEMLVFDTVTTAVNYVDIRNSATGNNVRISAAGSDTDVGLSLQTQGAGKVQVTDNDLDLQDSDANIQVAGADPKAGMRIPANALFPATTTGCATLAQGETTTNKINYKYLAFDGATEEYAWVHIPTPDWWDLSTIKIKFHWTPASGSGDVIWGAAGLARSDDDVLDTALGTAVTVTDTVLAVGDEHITAYTAAITVGGTPAKGDALYLRVYRDADAAGDTLNSVDAHLIAISVQFGRGQIDDQ